ncbi:MAG: hypothetical protein CMI60_15080 [Parvibaculum sp.]|jgi:hypothetical protein|nr:hypothetical protein [Parvibaculum sp.]|tara:strand:+ start:1501 stop:1932 length:432 start_codon:yes stop_codon:yes gene_type:complete
MRDLHSNLGIVQSLDPAVTTATRVGAPIDRQGYESVEHIVSLGMSGDVLSPSVSLALRLEESEDGTNWTAIVNDSDVLGAAVDGSGIFALVDDSSEDGQAFAIGYVGDARYCRVQVELTGTHSNGTPVAALALLGHGSVKPVS